MSTLTAPQNGTGNVSPTDAPSVLERLAGMGAEVREELEKLQQHRAEIVAAHQERLGRLDHQAVMLRRVLRTLDPETPLQSPRPKQVRRVVRPPRSPQFTGKGISLDKAVDYAEAIRKLSNEHPIFTIRELHEHLGGEGDSARHYGALNYLREIEFLAKLGQSGGRHSRTQWKIDQNDAIDRIVAIVKEKEAVHA